MSRSGYTDDCDDPNMLAMWRGQVASTIRGKRGQAFLRELIESLDAMPEKRLIANKLRDKDGCVCAIGSVGVKRGIEMDALDPEDPRGIAVAFGITHQMVSEIEWWNDEAGPNGDITGEKRWRRMRAWAVRHLKPEMPA